MNALIRVSGRRRLAFDALLVCIGQRSRSRFTQRYVHALRRHGAQVGRDRPRARSLHICLAIQRPAGSCCTAPVPLRLSMTLSSTCSVFHEFSIILSCIRTFGYVCSPAFQVSQTFWATWKEFEIKHGNEDTLREMLRIRRSVQATYNIQVAY